MQVNTVNKTQFASLNDKRFYFHDGIISLPFGHYLLEESRKEKEKYKNRNSKYDNETKIYFFNKRSRCSKKLQTIKVIEINI